MDEKIPGVHSDPEILGGTERRCLSEHACRFALFDTSRFVS